MKIHLRLWRKSDAFRDSHVPRSCCSAPLPSSDKTWRRTAQFSHVCRHVQVASGRFVWNAMLSAFPVAESNEAQGRSFYARGAAFIEVVCGVLSIPVAQMATRLQQTPHASPLTDSWIWPTQCVTRTISSECSPKQVFLVTERQDVCWEAGCTFRRILTSAD